MLSDKADEDAVPSLLRRVLLFAHRVAGSQELRRGEMGVDTDGDVVAL